MWALIQSLLKTKQSLYWLQRALEWTHNESLHSKQKNWEQKTWSKEERSFSPSSPRFTEKDGNARLIFPVLLHLTASPMKGLWPFSCLAVFLGSLFNSKNPLTQEPNDTSVVPSSPWHSVLPAWEQVSGAPLERAMSMYSSWGWCQKGWVPCLLLNNSKLRTKRSNNKELKCANQRTLLNPSLLKGHVIFRKLSKQLS